MIILIKEQTTEVYITQQKDVLIVLMCEDCPMYQ